MNIKLQKIALSFDDQGNTTAVTVSYSNYDNNGDQFNAAVVIKNNDLTSGTTLDDLNRKEFDKLAREKMVKWLQPQQTTNSVNK